VESSIRIQNIASVTTESQFQVSYVRYKNLKNVTEHDIICPSQERDVLYGQPLDSHVKLKLAESTRVGHRVIKKIPGLIIGSQWKINRATD